MKSGFTYKGIHSDTFGITVKTQDRPIVPSVKTTEYSALCMDGSYDFSAANSYGREFYDDRTFSMILRIYGDNLNELNKKMQKIAAWLLGSGTLVFDDTPLVEWSARCVETISFAPEIRGKKAAITVKFTVSPFAKCLIDSSGVVLDSDLELDTNIPLGTSDYYNASFTVPSSGGEVSGTLTIRNFGDRPIRPKITVTLPDVLPSSTGAYFTKVVLSNGDSTLEISGRCPSGSAPTITVDFDAQTVTNYTVTDISGEFFELSGEKPQISVVLTTANNTGAEVTGEISADFAPEAVWNFDISDYDWGDDDA